MHPAIRAGTCSGYGSDSVRQQRRTFSIVVQAASRSCAVLLTSAANTDTLRNIADRSRADLPLGPRWLGCGFSFVPPSLEAARPCSVGKDSTETWPRALAKEVTSEEECAALAALARRANTKRKGPVRSGFGAKRGTTAKPQGTAGNGRESAVICD